MPKVVIEIEDALHGKVQVKATPNLATLAKLRIDGDNFSPAESVAIIALREIHKQFKKSEELYRKGLIQ